MAGVGGAAGRGQLGGHPRQQVGQGACLDIYLAVRGRFDKEEAVVMDWHVDASIPLGEYSVQDRASNQPSRRLKLHKAPTRAFSCLKAATTTTFTLKTL